MKLIFSSTFSIWIILLLIIIFSVFTIAIYRRHALAKPYSIILPGLRIAAFIVLIFSQIILSLRILC